MSLNLIIGCFHVEQIWFALPYHFFSDLSGVPVCVPFDVSLLRIFLLFVCNPAKVCLWEKEDLTIYLLCCLLLCCCAVLFLLGVCFLTVCVKSGKIWEKEVLTIYLLCCVVHSFFCRMFVCVRREYWLFLLCHVVFFVIFHVYIRVCYLAFAWNLSLSAVWLMFVCERREYWLSICCALLFIYFLFVCVGNPAYVCLWEKGVLTPPPSNGRISSCPVNVHLHACYPSIHSSSSWNFST